MGIRIPESIHENPRAFFVMKSFRKQRFWTVSRAKLMQKPPKFSPAALSLLFFLSSPGFEPISLTSPGSQDTPPHPHPSPKVISTNFWRLKPYDPIMIAEWNSWTLLTGTETISGTQVTQPVFFFGKFPGIFREIWRGSEKSGKISGNFENSGIIPGILKFLEIIINIISMRFEYRNRVFRTKNACLPFDFQKNRLRRQTTLPLFLKNRSYDENDFGGKTNFKKYREKFREIWNP